MPNSTPAPRRASGAKRPSSSGRPAAGGRSGAPRTSNAERTPRDGAERRISRSAAPRGDRDGRPSGTSAAPRYRRDDDGRTPRPQSDRAPRRYDRDDTADDRRGRPSAASRGASRGGAPARGAGPARGEKTGRPGRPATGGRNANDTRSYGRDTRDLKSDRFDPRKPRPQRKARPIREVSPEELEKQKAAEFGRAKGWGGVARKGGMNISSTGQAMESTPTSGWNPDPLSEWVEEVRPARPAPAAKAKPKVKYALPGDVAADVRKAFIGTSYMREKMVILLTKAAEGYDRKRYEEALRLGREVADAVPGVASVRELTGLAAYKAERWNMAKIHLRAHFAITGDPEHLPLVMDCDRANRRFRAVEKTYEELQEAEPSADTTAEARIVMASALADQKKYTEAIDLLIRAGGSKVLRNPAFRHVRMWYALADVYDRAGDQVNARELFSRVVLADPDAYDAKERLMELGAVATVRKNRKRRTTSVSKKKVWADRRYLGRFTLLKRKCFA